MRLFLLIFKQCFTSPSLTIGCRFSSRKVHDFANILPPKLFTPTCQFFCTDVFVIFMTFRITASALYHSPLFANTFLFSAHFLLLAIVEFCTSSLWECPMLLNFSDPPSPSFNTLSNYNHICHLWTAKKHMLGPTPTLLYCYNKNVNKRNTRCFICTKSTESETLQMEAKTRDKK